MKKILILAFLIAFCHSTFAQETYTINNETFELKTEVEGELDFLWNTIDKEFRYFVRDDKGEIQELLNTKFLGKYQNEYLTTLSELTNKTITNDEVPFLLPNLKIFIEEYNASKDVNFEVTERVKLQSRIGVFGGITNNPLVTNPDNKSTPFFGLEYEILEANKLPRHAGFFSIRHALEHKDFEYSQTQLALGYRFRFINQPTFNIYANLKFATLTFSESPLRSISAFDVPFILGFGSDIKVGENSFITLAYNELFAIFVDDGGNFPIDFAIGYKINL